ncbi:MAG: hypothetical protein Aurels2KO_28150 [Aureliella sp.]
MDRPSRIVAAAYLMCIHSTLSFAQDGDRPKEKQISQPVSSLPELRTEVLKVCEEFEKTVESEYTAGFGAKIEVRIEAVENLCRARAAVATGPELVAIYEQAVEWFRDVERRFEQAVDSGRSDPLDLMRIKLKRLGMQIKLANLDAEQGESAQGKGASAVVQKQVDHGEKKWVYKVRTYGASVDLESILNRMAGQGWEFDKQVLLPMSQTGSTVLFNTRLVFKKPAP